MTANRGVQRLTPRSCWRIAALLSVALLAGPAGAAPRPLVRPLTEHQTVCIRGVCFDAEVAVTSAERSQGLMYRNKLAKDKAMLFVFPDAGNHRFWMKNTLIELDIVFIGADRRVVSIARRAQPCRKDPCDVYGPTGEIVYVLEVAGGLSAVYGFTEGDLVEFRVAAAGR